MVWLTVIFAVFKGDPELWMEHHYLLSQGDVAERQSWAAALEADPVGDDEVLVLSSGGVISRMAQIALDVPDHRAHFALVEQLLHGVHRPRHDFRA